MPHHRPLIALATLGIACPACRVRIGWRAHGPDDPARTHVRPLAVQAGGTDRARSPHARLLHDPDAVGEIAHALQDVLRAARGRRPDRRPQRRQSRPVRRRRRRSRRTSQRGRRLPDAGPLPDHDRRLSEGDRLEHAVQLPALQVGDGSRPLPATVAASIPVDPGGRRLPVHDPRAPAPEGDRAQLPRDPRDRSGGTEGSLHELARARSHTPSSSTRAPSPTRTPTSANRARSTASRHSVRCGSRATRRPRAY